MIVQYMASQKHNAIWCMTGLLLEMASSAFHVTVACPEPSVMVSQQKGQAVGRVEDGMGGLNM